MTSGSLSLSEYPAAMVRLKCSKCARSGQYRKITLIEKYGADVPLPDLPGQAGCRAGEIGARIILNL
jgi:hypothetical protein